MEWQHNQSDNCAVIEKALESTGREGIIKVISELRRLKFYDAPGSIKYHSNYRGGLAEHSLKVYLYAMKLKGEHPNQFGAVPDESIPIGHGEKSVIMLLRLGLEMTEEEMLAIRWHMGPCTFQEKSVDKENYDAARKSHAHSLIDLIRKADGIAAHEKNEPLNK